MEDFDNFWTFHESVVELKQKIQYMTYELEMTRNETNEEIRKNNEHIKKLLQLLQAACNERDEAKAQLKKVEQILSLNKHNHDFIDRHQIIPSTNTSISSAFPATPFSPDSPLLIPNLAAKTNSPVTDSSSFSFETQTNNNFSNHPQSHVSSPATSSPDSCNIAFNPASAGAAVVMSSTTVQAATKEVDQDSLIIASLAKRNALPQKGKLLQAVLEAGPLLSTLMVAGSLPQWRNPPGVQTHQIPLVNLKGCDGMISQSPRGTKFCTSQPPQSTNIVPQIEMPDVSGASLVKGMGLYSSICNGSYGFCPTSMLDFGSGSSGSSCFLGGRTMSHQGVTFDSQIPKRQRIV